MRDDEKSKSQLIDELKQARARISALSDQSNLEQQYLLLSQDMLDGFALHEILCDERGVPLDYRFLGVNPAFERLTGLAAEEIIGKRVLEVLPETESHWIETYGRVALTGEPVLFDGYSKDLGRHFEVAAFRTSQNRFACFFSDITDRRKTEEALRESEEKHRTLVEASLQGVVIAQADPVRLSFANTAMETITGFAVAELLAMGPEQLAALIHPEDRARFFENFQRRVSGEEMLSRDEYRIVRQDGALTWVQSYSSRITFGGAPATLAAFVDDTERKQLEEKLRISQKMEAIGRLAGGVAHDFNNMVCAIMGNAEMLLDDLTAGDPLEKPAQEIQKAAQRASDLTRQLLAFSRMQMIEPKIVNLGRLIENLQAMLVRLIGEDVILRTVPQEDLGRIRADPNQVEQIILNLAVNARDAMPDGGELVIETNNVQLDEQYCEAHINAAPGAYVMLAVSDTGHGMSAEIREKIFEPFFTTKGLGRGTGLGLATVFGIVEQSGGRIEVYSEPEKGSSFKVYFPRVQDKADPSPKETPQPPVGQETVLVVEDEEMVRSLSVRILERLGYQVLVADAPHDALTLAEQHEGKIDLLFTDVVMPHMNGRELANRITALHPTAKVLYTSGYTQNIIAHHGVLDEGLHFITKPYSVVTLSRKIRHVLGSE